MGGGGGWVASDASDARAWHCWAVGWVGCERTTDRNPNPNPSPNPDPNPNPTPTQELAKRKGLLHVCDSTFATPVIQAS